MRLTVRSILLVVAAASWCAATPAAFAQAGGGTPSPQTGQAGQATDPSRDGPEEGAEDGSEAAAAAGDDAPARQKITEVRIEGSRRVEREAIRRALRQKVGDVFDPALTKEDIRALWALGFFSDVRLLVQRLPKGLVYVVRVEERPVVREAKLEGNQELSEEDFKETLDIRPGSILDMAAVRANTKKVLEKYVEKGYFLAEVEPRIDPVPGTGEVLVVFVIREHAKVMVKQIHLLGAKNVPPEDLKAVMATKEGGLLSFLTSEGIYREELFDRDQAVIQSVYYDRGYINVKLDKPQLSLSPDKRFIYITLRIDEGERYKIGKLDFSGDLLRPKAELAAGQVTKEGDWFSRSALAQDITRLTDLYYDAGYAYANITPATRIDPDERTIDLTFDVQKGKQVTIERIDIAGNTKTRDKVIRRELRVYEGDLFSGTGLRTSKERVTALGFFETVEVSHRPGSDDAHVVVTVEIKEKPTGTFQLGFGFSNVESFILTGQVSQNNFAGWGQTVSASVQWSGLRNLIQFSYFDPYFLDTNFIFAIDAYRIEAEYPDFIRQSTGGTLNLGYHVFEDVMANLAYTNEYVFVEPGRGFSSSILLADRFRGGTTSSLRGSITWDRRDNRLFPTKGFMHFGSVEAAPQLLGGTFNFMRYTAYSRFYQPLPFGFVFKTNATIGYIQSLDADRPLPISELYHLGGINTVRGYYLRTISPTVLVAESERPDAQVTKFNVGGNKQLIFNVELEFPIFEQAGVRGVVFYDAGNAYAPNERFFQDKQDTRLWLGMFHATGVGLRWFSPIGPLRFEWGFPLTRRPEDQPMNFEFTIGNFF